MKRFQIKYKDQILAPAGIVVPSGIVAVATAAKINGMMCAVKTSCPYFTSYEKNGDPDSLEIVKIQDFLNVLSSPITDYPNTNTNINSGLKLSKTFSTNTDSAIRRFQSRYYQFVLKPWGLTSPTGNWYKTTQQAANKLMECKV